MDRIQNQIPYRLRAELPYIACGLLYLLGRSPLPIKRIPLNTTLLSGTLAGLGCLSYNAYRRRPDLREWIPGDTEMVCLIGAAVLMAMQHKRVRPFLPNMMEVENTRQLYLNTFIAGGATFALGTYLEVNAPQTLSSYYPDGTMEPDVIEETFSNMPEDEIDAIILRLNSGRLSYSGPEDNRDHHECVGILDNLQRRGRLRVKLEVTPYTYARVQDLNAEKANVLNDLNGVGVRFDDDVILSLQFREDIDDFVNHKIEDIPQLAAAISRVGDFNYASLPKATAARIFVAVMNREASLSLPQLQKIELDRKEFKSALRSYQERSIEGLPDEVSLYCLRVMLDHNHQFESFSPAFLNRILGSPLITPDDRHRLVQALISSRRLTNKMELLPHIPPEYIGALPEKIGEELLKDLIKHEIDRFDVLSKEQLQSVPPACFKDLFGGNVQRFVQAHMEGRIELTQDQIQQLNFTCVCSSDEKGLILNARDEGKIELSDKQVQQIQESFIFDRTGEGVKK